MRYDYRRELARTLSKDIHKIFGSSQKARNLETMIRKRIEAMPLPFFGFVDRGGKLISMAELERIYVTLVYEITGGCKSRMMEILGMSRQGVYNKLMEYGLYIPEKKTS